MERFAVGNDQRILVLADKRWRTKHPSPWLLIVLFLVLPAVLLVYLGMLIYPEATWGELIQKLGQFLAHINWGKALGNLALVGAGVGQIIYLRWAEQRERLTLSPDGLRYASPLPASLKRLHPDWFLSWNQISKVELSAPQNHLANATLVLMTLHTPSGKRRIRPAVWVDPETYARPATRFSLRLTTVKPQREEIIKEVMASEVMCYFAEHAPHLVIDSRLEHTSSATSLETNPHGRIATGIVFALMLYAFLDAIAGPESYIDAPSSLLHIYIASGVVGVVLAWAWLRRSQLPILERVGLAALIGVLVGVAMVPGALRINALTDSASSKSYDYFVTSSADGIVLRPVNDGLPNIDYFARHQYWDKYSRGEIYPVQVHKGILGFYQFNSSVIIDDIHNH